MRKILILVSLATLTACTGDDNAKVETATTDSTKTDNMNKTDNLNYPYTANYSSKFEIGDPNNVMTVLQLYKDWDNNTVDNSKDRFADSVILAFSNGTVLSGGRDSVVNAAKQFRNTMGTVTSVPVAWTPLKSTDKGEDWVAVWFTEHRTDAKGKTDSSYYQETWRLNKDGKIDRFYQYEAKTAPPAKK